MKTLLSKVIFVAYLVLIAQTATAKPQTFLEVNSLAFSADSSTLFAASGGPHNNNLRAWRVRDAEPLISVSGGALTGHRCEILAAGPVGHQLYTGAYKFVETWDRDSLRSNRVSPETDGYLLAIAVDPSGRHLARAEYISGADMSSFVSLTDTASGRVLHQMILEDSTMWFGRTYSVAFSPDGKRLAWGGSERGVLLWKAATGELIRELPGPNGGPEHGRNRQVVFSPRGHWLAAARTGYEVDDSERIRETSGEVAVWDLSEAAWKHRFSVVGAKKVTGVAFAPDGRTLAAVASDGSVRLWNLQTGGQALTVLSSAAELTAVAWSPDGRTIAVGDERGQVALLDPGTGTLRWLGCQGVSIKNAHRSDQCSRQPNGSPPEGQAQCILSEGFLTHRHGNCKSLRAIWDDTKHAHYPCPGVFETGLHPAGFSTLPVLPQILPQGSPSTGHESSMSP